MSFSSGFSSGAAAGGAIRDRYDDAKKRKEDIRLALEKEERQKAFEREQKATSLAADLEKMGYGGKLDLERLAAQLDGQGKLQGSAQAFTGGENALNRGHQAQQGDYDRTWKSQEAAAERAAKADQVKRELDMRESFGNSELGLKHAELGGRLLDAGTRASKADMAEITSALSDGSTVRRMVDPAQIPELSQGTARSGSAAPKGLTGDSLQAYEWALANPQDPKSAKILSRLGQR